MANSSLPERFAILSLESSGVRRDARASTFDLNVHSGCGSGDDDLCPPSPQRTERWFGARAGMFDLNAYPDCGSGLDDLCPPSPQHTDRWFGARAGIIDLNVDPGCGSPPFDLNAAAPDSDPGGFFVGWRSPFSEPIEFSRARFRDLEGLEVCKIVFDSDLEELIVAIGDECASDREASNRMQEHVALPSCLDCVRVLREGLEREVIDARIDERESDREQDEAEEDVDLNHRLEVLSLGRDSADAESYFIDDEYEAYEVLSRQFLTMKLLSVKSLRPPTLQLRASPRNSRHRKRLPSTMCSTHKGSQLAREQGGFLARISSRRNASGCGWESRKGVPRADMYCRGMISNMSSGGSRGGSSVAS